MQGFRWTVEEKNEAVQRYISGATSRQLARKYKCTRRDIRALMVEEGVKLSESDKKDIVKDYLKGYSPSVLGEEFLICRQAVRQIVSRAGVKPGDRAGKANITNASLRREKILSLYKSKSIDVIQAETGLSRRFICSVLSKDPSTREKYKSEISEVRRAASKSDALLQRDNEIRKKRKAGASAKELAREYGMSEVNIYRIARR